MTAAVKYREGEGYRIVDCLLLAGGAEVTRGPDIRHPNVIESRRGGYVLRSPVLGYRVAKAVVYVRGCTPSKTHYRSNVVHSSPAQSEVVLGLGSSQTLLEPDS